MRVPPSLLRRTPSAAEKFALSGETSIVARPVHPLKGRLEMDCSDAGRVTETREEQSRKTPVPSDLRFSERVTETREVQR